MDNFVIGNMVWNGGLVLLAGYFIKKWIKDSDQKAETNAINIKNNAVEARNETKDAAGILDHKIDGIYIELKTANGRVAKLEGRVETQIAICKERNLGRRASDKCGDPGI